MSGGLDPRALRMALTSPSSPTPTALCPRCKVPLIGTFAFPRFEFYCLDCGGHFDWLDPVPGDSAEHAADLAARDAEWNEHAGAKLVPPASWRDGCELCAARSALSYHADHATPAEVLADQNARRWLIDRVRT